ncbi:MAG: FHA domain-containing protein [Verrucomicrobiota bacterium]
MTDLFENNRLQETQFGPAHEPKGLRERLRYIRQLLVDFDPPLNTTCLLLRRDTGDVISFDLAEPRTIGRHLIRDASSKLSRDHFRIDPEGDLARLSDLDSANGVFVNGTKTRNRLLTDGDVIEAGGLIFGYVRAESE